MLHYVFLFALLGGMWFVFSGYTAPFFLIAGAISCAIAVVIALRMDVVDHEGAPLHLTWRAPGYLLWLVKEIVVSGFGVCLTVWQRSPDISPTIAWIPTRLNSDMCRTIYANSITLTPGTVCINVEDGRMEVHALQSISVDDLKAGGMERRVAIMTGEAI